MYFYFSLNSLFSNFILEIKILCRRSFPGSVEMPALWIPGQKIAFWEGLAAGGCHHLLHRQDPTPELGVSHSALQVVFQILVLLRRGVVPACSCRPVLVALLCGSCTQLWCSSLFCQTSAPGRIKVLCSNQTIILDNSNFTQSLKELEKAKTWNVLVSSSLTVSFSSWPFSTRISFPVWKSTDKHVCRQTPRDALIILRLRQI